jgi:dihydrofolate synthase/folylpolyglutamate synthase
LTGNYQKHNIITVLHAVKSLQENGFVISENHIRTGLKQVKTNTGLKGRWDILSRMPLIVSDTGHNEDGIKEIVEQLLTIKYNKLFIVFGMVNDKLPDKVLSALPKHAIYFFCKADMPRAMNDEDLFEIAKTFGLQGNFYGSVENALNEAKKQASSNDLIFVGGSTFVAAEIL